MTAPIDDYRIYLDNTFQLAKTMSIKHEDAATLMNTGLMERYGKTSVDLNTPTSWKYYLNAAGEYHTTDTLMEVVSLDTLETIAFTKSNLYEHTATMAAYQYGTRYYQTLVQAYPDQENLILGILYPCNLYYAVGAPNGALLAYDTGLIEPQEATLLHDLEQWIQRYMARWHVRAFIHSDTLYAAAQIAGLYLQLVPVLLNLRLRRCKTAEAHSFHIKQYLASHGQLDRYWDFLTLKQALWLYRNVDTLQHYVGHQATLDLLIEHLLTDRYIPIADYTMKQLTDYDTDFYPAYEFVKKPLNGQYNMPRKDSFTLDELLLREQPLAPGNPSLAQEERQGIDLAFKTSVSGVVQTKDLESSLIDYTDAVPYKLTDVLLNHWLYFISVDRYPIVVNFRDPVTGDQRSLNSRSAFLYLVYLTAAQYGYPLETIPVLYANHVFRWPVLRLETSGQWGGRNRISQSEIQYWINRVPRLRSFYSRTAFFSWGQQAYALQHQHWYWISRIEHQTARAAAVQLIESLHHDPVIQLPEVGQSYPAWLAEHSLPEAHYTRSEFQLLIQTVFTAATGYRQDPTKSAMNIQKAMLGILKQLSSYSIQTLAQVNEKPVRLIEWASIRMGDSRVHLDALVALKSGIGPKRQQCEYTSRIALTTPKATVYTATAIRHGRSILTVENPIRIAHILHRRHYIPMARIHIQPETVPLEAAVIAYGLNHPSTLTA